MGINYIAGVAVTSQSLKLILAPIIGIFLAFAFIYAAQMLGNQLDPMVAVADPVDDSALELQIPLINSLCLLLGWFAGAFAGSWLAMRISGAAGAGWVVAGAVIGATLYRALTIGDATWVIGAGFLLPLMAGWLAGRAVNLAD